MKKKTRLDLMNGYELVIESEVEKKNAQVIMDQGSCEYIKCSECPLSIKDGGCAYGFGAIRLLHDMGYRKSK